MLQNDPVAVMALQGAMKLLGFSGKSPYGPDGFNTWNFEVYLSTNGRLVVDAWWELRVAFVSMAHGPHSACFITERELREQCMMRGFNVPDRLIPVASGNLMIDAIISLSLDLWTDSQREMVMRYLFPQIVVRQ